MRKRTLIIATALTLLGASLALGAEEAAPPRAETAEAPAPQASGHPQLEGAKPVDGHSLYQLTLSLEDQDGQRISLDHYRGHPVLISLFYASCPSACPLLIKDIQRIEAALSPEARARTRVLLVSIDPEHDTPTALAATVVRYGVDGTRWRLTRAEDAQVRELAAVLGIKYRRETNGALGHTSRLTLLDGGGVPVGRLDGLSQPVEALVMEIEAMKGDAP